MFKISVKKYSLLIKSRNLWKTFPGEYVFFATSRKCLCTHFGHMAKIKTSLKIILRKAEHKNQLSDHRFFYRLWSNQILLLLSYRSSKFCLKVWNIFCLWTWDVRSSFFLNIFSYIAFLPIYIPRLLSFISEGKALYLCSFLYILNPHIVKFHFSFDMASRSM